MHRGHIPPLSDAFDSVHGDLPQCLVCGAVGKEVEFALDDVEILVHGGEGALAPLRLAEQSDGPFDVGVVFEWASEEATKLLCRGRVLFERVQHGQGKHAFAEVGAWSFPGLALSE